jgi:hypothetical protein
MGPCKEGQGDEKNSPATLRASGGPHAQAEKVFEMTTKQIEPDVDARHQQGATEDLDTQLCTSGEQTWELWRTDAGH